MKRTWTAREALEDLARGFDDMSAGGDLGDITRFDRAAKACRAHPAYEASPEPLHNCHTCVRAIMLGEPNEGCLNFAENVWAWIRKKGTHDANNCRTDADGCPGWARK